MITVSIYIIVIITVFVKSFFNFFQYVLQKYFVLFFFLIFHEE